MNNSLAAGLFRFVCSLVQLTCLWSRTGSFFMPKLCVSPFPIYSQVCLNHTCVLAGLKLSIFERYCWENENWVSSSERTFVSPTSLMKDIYPSCVDNFQSLVKRYMSTGDTRMIWTCVFTKEDSLDYTSCYEKILCYQLLTNYQINKWCDTVSEQ